MRRDPQDNARALLAFAGVQSGLFTAGQAKRAGYTYRQQHFHVARGNWERIERGLFRLRYYPPGEREDLVIASLWSRERSGEPQAVVSHETALELYGLSDILPARIHLTVPPGFRKKGEYTLHKAALDRKTETRLHEGYRVTTPLRTLLDAARSALSREHLHAAVRDALRKGLVTPSQLAALGEPLAGALRAARAA